MVKKDDANMKVSVIIPTYNGAHKITTVLKALEQQTYHDFETIVVIDGSTDNTFDLLKGLNPKLKEFSYQFQSNKGRAAVRNTGAKAAAGDLLIFFDDDMRPEPDCVQKHIAFHSNKSIKCMAVGNTPEDRALCETDFHRYKSYLTEKWIHSLKQLSGPIPDEITFLAAANFSVLKSLFMQMGGFNEKLRDAEDYDLALRAKGLKIPIYFLPDAISWHNDFFTMQRFIDRQREYRENHKLLKTLNADNSQYLEKTLRAKKIIRSLFSSSLWVIIIDGKNPFMILPKLFRYKLYDVIIQAQLEK